MRPIAKIIGGLFILAFSSSLSVSAQRHDRIYELYHSTSTPAIYKDRMGAVLEGIERRRDVIKKARQKSAQAPKQAPFRAAAVQSADASFKAGEVYCFPNPAKKTNPTFNIETGIADKVELNVYDVSGSLVHNTVLTGQPQIINDGQGPQYAYEFAWDVSKTGSGVYLYSVKAVKGAQVIRKSGKCAVIR